MAAVTVYGDFRAQKRKSITVSNFFPIYLAWSDGISFLNVFLYRLLQTIYFKVSVHVFIWKHQLLLATHRISLSRVGSLVEAMDSSCGMCVLHAGSGAHAFSSSSMQGYCSTAYVTLVPGPGIRSISPALQGGFRTPGPPRKFQLLQSIEYSSLGYPVGSFWLFTLYIVVPGCSVTQSCPSDSLWPTWTVAHQASLSIEFSRQEYWSGLPFPPPGDLSNPGIKPIFPVTPALAARIFTTELLGKHIVVCLC